MEILIMGCGTSQGCPLPAHDNPGLDLKNERNWRARTSIHVVIEGHHVQVDAAPEFRTQCLKYDVREVDTFILTHGHADHVLGMDDLRQFCTNKGGAAIPVYSTEVGLERIKAIFPYAVGKPQASGYVSLGLNLMPAKLVLPGGGIIRSTLLPHGNESTLGLIFEEPSTGRKFAYYTDCKRVPREALELARGVDALALDGLRPTPHPSHLSIAEAIEVARDIGAPATWLTHLTHHTDHGPAEAELPEGVRFAYDGLRLRL